MTPISAIVDCIGNPSKAIPIIVIYTNDCPAIVYIRMKLNANLVYMVMNKKHGWIVAYLVIVFGFTQITGIHLRAAKETSKTIA